MGGPGLHRRTGRGAVHGVLPTVGVGESGEADAFASPEDAFAARHRQPQVAVADLERSARRVVGVLGCRVLRPEAAAVPVCVRLVAEARRRSAIAKDIQSAWFTLFGLYVPRRLFMVTAVRSRLDLLGERRRLQLCRCTIERRLDGIRAEVGLFAAGRVVVGRAQDGPGGDDRRLAAMAVLDAVRTALSSPLPLALLEVRLTPVAGVPVALCAVGVGGEPLLGICQVRGDEREACVRAALDAVNRTLSREADGRPSRPVRAPRRPGRSGGPKERIGTSGNV